MSVSPLVNSTASGGERIERHPRVERREVAARAVVERAVGVHRQGRHPGAGEQRGGRLPSLPGASIAARMPVAYQREQRGGRLPPFPGTVRTLTAGTLAGPHARRAPAPRGAIHFGTVSRRCCSPTASHHRREPVADQGIGAEDADVEGVEIEREQADQDDAVAEPRERSTGRGQPGPAPPRVRAGPALRRVPVRARTGPALLRVPARVRTGPALRRVPAQQHDEADRGEHEPRQRQLPQRLVAEPEQVLDPVAPVRADAGIDPGVAPAGRCSARSPSCSRAARGS